MSVLNDDQISCGVEGPARLSDLLAKNEGDLLEYQQEIESRGNVRLSGEWLPIYTTKRAGYQLNKISQRDIRLGMLICHELENESVSYQEWQGYLRQTICDDGQEDLYPRFTAEIVSQYLSCHGNATQSTLLCDRNLDDMLALTWSRPRAAVENDGKDSQFLHGKMSTVDTLSSTPIYQGRAREEQASSSMSQASSINGQHARKSETKVHCGPTCSSNFPNGPLQETSIGEGGSNIADEHKIAKSPLGRDGVSQNEPRPIKNADDKQSGVKLECSLNANEGTAMQCLLEGFLELRSRKTAKRTLTPDNRVKLRQEIVLAEDETNVKDYDRCSPIPLSLGLEPAFASAAQSAPLLIHVGVDELFLSALEDKWPIEHLIDRDFGLDRVSALETCGEHNDTVDCEVDLALTPDIGLVITSLVKVKQRPLPGSRHPTATRQRLQNISAKYRHVIVLVSERNSRGEYMDMLPPADLEAYADFVWYTSALEAFITVYFVPGAEKTLAKWALSVIQQHIPAMVGLGETIPAHETTWEHFLRRAGLSVRGAQLLAHYLYKDHGRLGLARLLSSLETKHGNVDVRLQVRKLLRRRLMQQTIENG